MSETNEDVKEEVAVETTETPSVEEETTEEVTTNESPEASETPEEVTETDESTNKGANQRIRELNAEKKAAEQKATENEAKAQSLAQRLEELTGSNEPMGQPYQPSVEPGSEISPEQYKQDVMRTADGIVTLKLKQQEAIGRIKSESVEAVRKYPELDPESEHFNKELADDVYDSMDALVHKNPYSAAILKSIDNKMKLYRRAVDTEVGKVSENLAKQVSQSALKPTSVRNEDKSDNEKSIAELEAELGIVNS